MPMSVEQIRFQISQLQICVEDLMAVRGKIKRYQDDLNIAWNAPEMVWINESLSDIEHKILKAADLIGKLEFEINRVINTTC